MKETEVIFLTELSNVKGIHVTKPQGAFYMSILFEDSILNDNQYLTLDSPEVKTFVEEKTLGVETDKRFVYYLLGATGICVVPLTGFCCERKGFRLTLLESDDKKRVWTWIKQAYIWCKNVRQGRKG